MKKQIEVKETALTVDELKKMGEMIADIIATIELFNNALNVTPTPSDVGPGSFSAQYYALYELTSSMFHMNQKMMKDLDYISLTLLENADAFEIKSVRKKFN